MGGRRGGLLPCGSCVTALIPVGELAEGRGLFCVLTDQIGSPAAFPNPQKRDCPCSTHCPWSWGAESALHWLPCSPGLGISAPHRQVGLRQWKCWGRNYGGGRQRAQGGGKMLNLLSVLLTSPFVSASKQAGVLGRSLLGTRSSPAPWGDGF